MDIDGDLFYVRSMTLSEGKKADAFSKNPDTILDGAAYVLSQCVVEPDGTKVFESESDPAIQDVPLDVQVRLTEEIRLATRAPSPESAKKNSAETTSSAS